MDVLHLGDDHVSYPAIDNIQYVTYILYIRRDVDLRILICNFRCTKLFVTIHESFMMHKLCSILVTGMKDQIRPDSLLSRNDGQNMGILS